MNNINFDPYEDMPTCDICGAVMDSFRIGRDEEDYGSVPLTLIAKFACGAEWCAKQPKRFAGGDNFPHGDVAPYGSPREWIESTPCGNAAEVIRRQRKACKETKA